MLKDLSVLEHIYVSIFLRSKRTVKESFMLDLKDRISGFEFLLFVTKKKAASCEEAAFARKYNSN